MFPFLSHRLLTLHNAQNTSWLSPRLWNRVTHRITESQGDKRVMLVGDDFFGVHHAGTMTDLHAEHPYVLYADDTSNHKAQGASDENGGVLQLQIDASAGANEEIGIELGDGTGQLGQISDTAGSDFLTAFECRVKWNHITDAALTNGNIVSAIGLLGPGSNDGDVLTDTSGIPTAANHGIGFHVPKDDGDTVNFFYEAASQTRVDAISDIAALTNDTFVKLGFLYDPLAEASKRITVFVDNVASATYVTATNIATATFPDAETLNFVAAMKSIAGSDNVEMAIDWWAFCQIF
jgi:hypothetical protein